MTEPSLQDLYWPDGVCFGCGPENPDGLHLKSYPRGDVVVAEWTPGPNHRAFPGVMYGGLIGALFDCHCNVTAYHALLSRSGERAPLTVTASYKVSFLAPTSIEGPVRLTARAVEIRDRSARVEAELTSDGTTTAACEGVFVRPRP